VTDPLPVRTHNPGAIRWDGYDADGGLPWKGLATAQSEPPGPYVTTPGNGRFCVFLSPVWGFRAAALLLKGSVYFGAGTDTLTKIFQVWAPTSDGNNPAAYAAAVAADTGWTVDETLTYGGDLLRKPKPGSTGDRGLLAAIAAHESGESTWGTDWTQAQVDAGVEAALGGADPDIPDPVIPPVTAVSGTLIGVHRVASTVQTVVQTVADTAERRSRLGNDVPIGQIVQLEEEEKLEYFDHRGVWTTFGSAGGTVIDPRTITAAMIQSGQIQPRHIQDPDSTISDERLLSVRLIAPDTPDAGYQFVYADPSAGGLPGPGTVLNSMLADTAVTPRVMAFDPKLRDSLDDGYAVCLEWVEPSSPDADDGGFRLRASPLWNIAGSIIGSQINSGTIAPRMLVGTVPQSDQSGKIVQVRSKFVTGADLWTHHFELADALPPAPAAGSITGAMIANKAIGALKLAPTPKAGFLQLYDASQDPATNIWTLRWVDAPAPAAGSITGAQIADRTVAGVKMQDRSIGVRQLGTRNKGGAGDVLQLYWLDQDSGILGLQWAQAAAATSFSALTGTILASQIDTGRIVNKMIGNGQVSQAKIADNAVTNAKIADSAVDTNEIAAGAVTNAKIASGAVTGTQIARGAVGTDQIQSSGVDTSEIASGAVTNPKLKGGAGEEAVTSNKIRAGNVIGTKIASAAITNAKVASSAITPVKVSMSSSTSRFSRELGMDSTRRNFHYRSASVRLGVWDADRAAYAALQVPSDAWRRGVPIAVQTGSGTVVLRRCPRRGSLERLDGSSEPLPRVTDFDRRIRLRSAGR